MAATYWRAAFRCAAQDADPYQTGFGLRANNETGNASPAEICDAIDSALTTAFRAVLGSVDTLVDIHVVEFGASGVPLAGTKTKNLAGTRSITSAEAPKGCVPVLSLHTGFASRRARGWQFLPPIIDSDFESAGLILTASSLWSAMATYGDALLGLAGDSAGPNSTVDPGVLSEAGFNASEDFFFPYTGYTRRQKVHWLRSRSLLAQ